MSLQIEQVRPLRQRGLSYSQIAKEFGVKRGAVAGVLWRAANPEKTIAYNLRRSANKSVKLTLEQRAQFARRCFPNNARDQRFLDLYTDGLTTKQIGAVCGCNAETVRIHLMRMGSVHKLTAITSVIGPEMEDEADD
jgi:DNA-directed RNA polymerase specialized sigma24 family protein